LKVRYIPLQTLPCFNNDNSTIVEDSTLDVFYIYVPESKAMEEQLQSLPLRFPLKITLRSLDNVNGTLIAKYTMDTAPGLYPRESLALERRHILSQSLLNLTYAYRPVQPMDTAQLPMIQHIIPLVTSICSFLLGTGLIFWMHIRVKIKCLIVKRSMVMLIGAHLLNVLYVAISSFDMNATSCYSLHILSSLIAAVVQRYTGVAYKLNK
jgi:hypothetical protein